MLTSYVIEGVRYWRFQVIYRLSDGRRRQLIRWSPGFPWVYKEVVRELLERHGETGVKPHSAMIIFTCPLPSAVGEGKETG